MYFHMNTNYFDWIKIYFYIIKKSDIDENICYWIRMYFGWIKTFWYHMIFDIIFVFLQHFSNHSGLDVYSFIEKENYTAADVILWISKIFKKNCFLEHVRTNASDMIFLLSFFYFTSLEIHGQKIIASKTS